MQFVFLQVWRGGEKITNVEKWVLLLTGMSNSADEEAHLATGRP